MNSIYVYRARDDAKFVSNEQNVIRFDISLRLFILDAMAVICLDQKSSTIEMILS